MHIAQPGELDLILLVVEAPQDLAAGDAVGEKAANLADMALPDRAQGAIDPELYGGVGGDDLPRHRMDGSQEDAHPEQHLWIAAHAVHVPPGEPLALIEQELGSAHHRRAVVRSQRTGTNESSDAVFDRHEIVTPASALFAT